MDALQYFGFSEGDLVEGVGGGLRDRVGRGELSRAEAAALIEDYRGRIRGYPYLEC